MDIKAKYSTNGIYVRLYKFFRPIRINFYVYILKNFVYELIQTISI